MLKISLIDRTFDRRQIDRIYMTAFIKGHDLNLMRYAPCFAGNTLDQVNLLQRNSISGP